MGLGGIVRAWSFILSQMGASGGSGQRKAQK